MMEFLAFANLNNFLIIYWCSQLTSREEAAFNYNSKLKERFQHHPQIRRINRWVNENYGLAFALKSSVTAILIGSISNHDDDGNKNPTNLHIWQWKTVFLHALHVHFSSFDILKTFSFFLRREMTCFAVVWTTSAYDDKCSILSSYAPSACSNLIPGQLEHIFQA